MVKIAENRYGKVSEYDLTYFIAKKLDGDDYGTGSVEAARRTADNAAEALGKLLDTLVSKGVLDLAEALAVVGEHGDITVIPDFS